MHKPQRITIPMFLAVLPIMLGRGWAVKEYILHGRGDIRDRDGCCPIVALVKVTLGPQARIDGLPLVPEDELAANDALREKTGAYIDREDIFLITSAADQFFGHSSPTKQVKRLRRKMLAILGLEEPPRAAL